MVIYQNDHLGTPQKMTGVNGAVVWSAKYSSFLAANVDTSFTITNNLRASGQYYDSETGLHYNWFRYYEPILGRYLRTDPIGFYGGDANLYNYVWDNPINFIDPYGLFKKKCNESYSDCYDRCTGTGILGAAYKVSNFLGVASEISFAASVGSTILSNSVLESSKKNLRDRRQTPVFDGKKEWKKFGADHKRAANIKRIGKLTKVLKWSSRVSGVSTIVFTATNFGIRYYCYSSCK